MSAEHIEARPGAYADSVTLMQASTDVRKADGVEAALIAMATELNLDLLAEMGFAAPPQVGPNDLLVAVRAKDDAALAGALVAVNTALARRPVPQDGAATQQAPRTTAAAARRGGPGLVLVSVPGRHAFAEAMDALDAGCDVMIFSDNVPVEQEITLKDIAAERGLLVMGPDCGTAVVGGVGLGFAQRRRPGPVGLVAASGTGAQQVLSLLDAAGVGVSAALGVGGRDLSTAVGGRSARAALAALDDDPATELIVVISKPPAPQVAADLRAYATGLSTPVQFAFVAPGEPDLTAATEDALAATGQAGPGLAALAGRRGHAPARRAARPVRGGTLCAEAMVIASERLGPIRSNIPLRPEWHLGARAPTHGHMMIDFGDDELTVGRAHPMIDQSLRLERLAAEAADPATAAILLDVVLGHGAHPDPASELAPAIAAAREPKRGGGRRFADRDGRRPAGSRPGRPGELQAAGAQVFASNAQAARFACERDCGPAMTDLLRREPHVISAGLGLLADAAEWQAARVTRVDWRPPMAGIEEDLVTVLADPRRAAANALAVERMLAARAQLVDVLPAREALGLRPGQFLHAGPPIAWDRASGPLRGALMGAAVFEGLAADPDAAGGLAERRRVRAGALPPPPRGRARWPGWSRRRCGFSSWRIPRPGSGPTARSTRAWARCCATAPTRPT